MTDFSAHVLYVITDLDLGGVPLHLLRLARAMRVHGFKITVASLRDEGPVGRMLREEGVAVHACRAAGRWDIRVVSRLQQIIRDTQPHLIHSFLFHANLAVKLAAPRAGFPRERVLCEIQTAEVERPWHLWVDAWTYDLCRFTIGNSPSVLKHLAEKAHIPRESLRLVQGGIDPEPIRNAPPADRAALGLRYDDVVVLWVGRLDPVKGLEYLIDAFALILKNIDAHFALVGGGPMRAALEQLVDRERLKHRVHFLGPRQDVPALLKTADAFAFPSRTEGLPNALLEAMAAGLPAVTTDVPGCRDLIRHQETGLLVPYGDTSALAAALRQLLTDRSLADRLGAAAAEEVSTRWHINETHRMYAASYQEALLDTQ